jgi:toxin CptA
MFQHSEPPLLLIIKPSLSLTVLVILIHALALVASMANDLNLTFKLGLISCICLQGWLTVKHLKNEPYTIQYTETLGWQISKGHELVSIKILNSTVVTTFAIFLHYKENSQPQCSMSPAKQTCLILNDALAEEDYRRLIVKLKITYIK